MTFLRYSTIALFLLTLASCSRPIASFTDSVNEVEAPGKITFSNQSQKASTYLWDFGDGDNSTEMSPSHVYLHSGTYNVTLKACAGKKSTMQTKTIQVLPPKKCLVMIETKFGNMLVELYDATPLHRDNFLKLVEKGYYNDLIFHRVINGFMIQGGDPNSRNASPDARLGSGGPGYTIPAEFVDTLFHFKGALAAARLGDAQNPEKQSSGSQFYIVQGGPVDDNLLESKEAQKGFHYPAWAVQKYKEVGGTPHLDKDYTVFGQVIEGLDVIDKIAAQPTGPGNRPASDIKMKISSIR